jgi:hypothetical protein
MLAWAASLWASCASSASARALDTPSFQSNRG